MVFLVMTMILATVLDLSIIIFNRIKVASSAGNAVSAFYASESGIEKSLYYDRKQITTVYVRGQFTPTGHGRQLAKKIQNQRGLCDICNTCADCRNCTLTPLSLNGCDANTCNNCQVSYNSVFDDRTFIVNITTNPNNFFTCVSQGQYKNSNRTIQVTTNSLTGLPAEQ